MIVLRQVEIVWNDEAWSRRGRFRAELGELFCRDLEVAQAEWHQASAEAALVEGVGDGSPHHDLQRFFGHRALRQQCRRLQRQT